MRILLAILLASMLVSACQTHPSGETPDAGIAFFTHVHLDVADPQASKLLWADVFEGELAERQGYVAVRLADALVFLREQEPGAPSTDTVLDHIGLVVRDLDAVLGRWRGYGFESDSAGRSDDGTRRAAITTPNGAKLSLREDAELTSAATIEYLQFRSARSSQQLDWYANLFGAAVDANADRPEASIGGVRLLFSESDRERAPTEGSAIDHIGFEVADIDAFAQLLEARGLGFESGPFDVESLGIKVAFLPDPAGALVEVSEGLADY